MKTIGFFKLLSYIIGFERKKLIIFYLRGGLGNQLFQIAGVAFQNQSFQRDIVFCDSDVKLNFRDKDGAAVSELDLLELFTPSTSTFYVGRSATILVRLLRRSAVCKNFVPRVNLDSNAELPQARIITAYGYLQVAKYGETIPRESMLKAFSTSQVDKLSSGSVAMHIRGTDALVQKEMVLDLAYYRDAIIALGIQAHDEIDIYTDDFEYAMEICSRIEQQQFHFPELTAPLSPVELLKTLSSYGKIISSKSTLCWWAALLSQNRNQDTRIASPWPEDLKVSQWISIY